MKLVVQAVCAGALALGTLGCSEVTRTQLLVWVFTDVPGTAWNRVDVRVEGLDGVVPLDGPIDVPGSFGILPKNGDTEHNVTVTATLVREEAPLLQTVSRTSFLAHRKLRLDMFLSILCLDRLCPEGETCRAGQCEPIDVPVETLPAGNEPPTLPDAGVLADAGTSPDAGVDTGPSPCRNCDPPSGSGCDPNEACRADPDCTRCVPEGRGGWGDLCATDADCGALLACLVLDVNGGGVGTCQRYCEGDQDCGGRGFCVPDTRPGVGLCSGGCHPGGAGDCPEGSQCTVLPEPALGGDWLSYCVAPGERGPNADCGLGECGAGLGCLLAYGPVGQCRPYCGTNAECGAGSSCLAVSPSSLYGVCGSECDPIGQSGCSAGLSCLIADGTEPTTLAPVRVLVCGEEGGVGVSMSCLADYCEATAYCAPTSQECRVICDVSDSGFCGGTCSSLDPPVYGGTHEYGICT